MTYKPTALERKIEHHEALERSRPASVSSGSIKGKDFKTEIAPAESKDKSELFAMALLHLIDFMYSFAPCPQDALPVGCLLLHPSLLRKVCLIVSLR